MVGSSWKGVDYIRSLPTTVRNPRTPKQVTQRSKFSVVIQFVRSILPVVQQGFKNEAGSGSSAYNEAVSHNLRHATKGEFPDIEIDFPKVMISKGNLVGANGVVSGCTDGMINIGWNDDERHNAKIDDRTVIVAYNPERQEALYDLDAGSRRDGMAVVIAPDTWIGEEVETYLAFISEDLKLTSDSIYAGRVEVTGA